MRNSFLRLLIKYFFQGLIILAPIAITMWGVIYMFNAIDGILPNLIHQFFPSLIGLDSDGSPKRIPGLGFIVVIFIVFLVGIVSSSFVVSRLVELFDKVLEKAPGVKIIYSTVKDFFEAFAGDKKKFTKPVLVSLHDNDVWQIGFITQQNVEEFGLIDHVAVYIPFSYSIAGQLYFLPTSRVKLAKNISSTEAMKFAISGGVTEVEEGIQEIIDKDQEEKLKERN